MGQLRARLIKEEMLKRYNRPWWRLVRWWDRQTRQCKCVDCRRDRGEA